MIKKYLKFLKEGVSKYQYGCVMIDFNFENWKELSSNIDKNDIYEKEGENYGIVPRAHLTLFYGLHSEVLDEQVISCFDGFKLDDFVIEIDGITTFENPEFDVVKLNVILTDVLKEVNSRLSKLPNGNRFPVYKPHITIAYTKSGTAHKYVKNDYNYLVKNIKAITYSRADNTELEINL